LTNFYERRCHFSFKKTEVSRATFDKVSNLHHVHHFGNRKVQLPQN
jgi:hypothetical protein